MCILQYNREFAAGVWPPAALSASQAVPGALASERPFSAVAAVPAAGNPSAGSFWATAGGLSQDASEGFGTLQPSEETSRAEASLETPDQHFQVCLVLFTSPRLRQRQAYVSGSFWVLQTGKFSL